MGRHKPEMKRVHRKKIRLRKLRAKSRRQAGETAKKK